LTIVVSTRIAPPFFAHSTWSHPAIARQKWEGLPPYPPAEPDGH